MRSHGLCCLPNGDIGVADGFQNKMKIFDSGGRSVSTFGFFESWLHRDVCYLDRWKAHTSSASSLFLIAEPLKRVSIWDANHLQQISNIDLDIFPYNMCVDLNGFIYVWDFIRIRILDPRKNYRQVQTLCCNGGSFSNICIDDRNRLVVIDNWEKQLNIFD